MSAFIYSVGLGLGDPEMITVKAKRILESADVIITPQSNQLGKSVARDIVLNYVDAAKLHMYYFPMNNQQAELDLKYACLADEIDLMLRENKNVVFVTMGDPTIFSTSNYLTAQLIKRHILVKHIAGINTVNTLSTLLGVPVCIKGENFGVYEMPADVSIAIKLIRRHFTTIFMKVNKKTAILKQAIAGCNPDSAYLVQKAGLPGQEIINLLTDTCSDEPVYLASAFIRFKPDPLEI